MKRPHRATFESMEPRVLLAADLRPTSSGAVVAQYSFDGSNNNLLHPDWGSVGEQLLRTVAAEYSDGVASPAGADRPSAREISNAIADQAGQDITSDRFLSAMIYAWGQFIDHDLDLTASGSTEFFPVQVPQGDPWFDPQGTGRQMIPLNRSAFDPSTGTSPENPRAQINDLTSWLDGSMIYGTSEETAHSLRTLQGGRLQTSEGDLLPLNNSETFPNGVLPMGNTRVHVPDDEVFAAGDIRANENIELTALQTLFVREHNYWADRISQSNPRLSDEAVYQQARAIVIAEIQAITFREWLPAVLGRGAVDQYHGYKPNVNPGISNEFATAAFRFGHSLLGDDVEFLDNQGREVAEEVSLAEAFFNPAIIAENGIDGVLKYLASDPSSELDSKVVDSVRNFLFGPPGSGGLDLASLNIQRGRDHGLADYNAVREAYGLAPVTSFDQITSNPEVAAKLQQLYGSVDKIDLWVGLLAEDHAPGASVGRTAQAIIADQFERLRDGDRFWYEKTFSGRQLREIQETTLADIIRRNTEITNLQRDAFFFRAAIDGQVHVDTDRDGRFDLGEPMAAGVTVELVEAESGEAIATTITDARGRYHFDVLDGIRTADYFVRALVGTNGTAMPASGVVSVTRGEQFLQNVNVALAPKVQAPPARPHVPGRLPPQDNHPPQQVAVREQSESAAQAEKRQVDARAKVMLAQAMTARVAAVDSVFDQLATPRSPQGQRGK